jgi:hypothetical protein
MQFYTTDCDFHQYERILTGTSSVVELDLCSPFRAADDFSRARWLHIASQIMTITWARKLEGTSNQTSACVDPGFCTKIRSCLFLVQQCLANENCWWNQDIVIPHLLKIFQFSLRIFLGDFGQGDYRLALLSTPGKVRAVSNHLIFEIASISVLTNGHERFFPQVSTCRTDHLTEVTDCTIHIHRDWIAFWSKLSRSWSVTPLHQITPRAWLFKFLRTYLDISGRNMKATFWWGSFAITLQKGVSFHSNRRPQGKSFNNTKKRYVSLLTTYCRIFLKMKPLIGLNLTILWRMVEETEP